MKPIFQPLEVRGTAEAVKEMDVAMEEMLVKVGHYVGIKTISWLRELINETRPPIRPGEPARKARQGHWADNTGNLARAYSYEVESVPGRVTVVFQNAMEYAAALDVREGFFVLRGVADKGGPVEQALREALRELAPDVELRYE